ncbi:MAG: phosphatidate cytidylyltransferase [Bacillota bacterium]|nr:phosphatidate cytidylyltransferase [Bacillota bacterium]
MNSRYLGAIILAPLLIFLLVGGLWLKGLLIALSLIGLYEFYKVCRQVDLVPVSIIGYILCIIYYSVLDTDFNLQLIMYIIIAAFIVTFILVVVDEKYNFIGIAVTIFGFLYVPVFFGFIYQISIKEHGNFLVWLVFISSWVCDTSAYYVGKYFGRNKLCPRVSPKKTVEGSLGGLFGSVIGCLVFGMISNHYGVVIPLYHYIVIGVICGVLSQLGDLSASSIKRYAGVKDYSNLIPGHGGILDRFDSILFAAVAVFYYLTFIVNIK